MAIFRLRNQLEDVECALAAAVKALRSAEMELCDVQGTTGRGDSGQMQREGQEMP